MPTTLPLPIHILLSLIRIPTPAPSLPVSHRNENFTQSNVTQPENKVVRSEGVESEVERVSVKTSVTAIYVFLPPSV